MILGLGFQSRRHPPFRHFTLAQNIGERRGALWPALVNQVLRNVPLRLFLSRNGISNCQRATPPPRSAPNLLSDKTAGCAIHRTLHWCCLWLVPSPNTPGRVRRAQDRSCNPPAGAFNSTSEGGMDKEAGGSQKCRQCVSPSLGALRPLAAFRLLILIILLALVTDPEDPRFDLEKLIARWETAS